MRRAVSGLILTLILLGVFTSASKTRLLKAGSENSTPDEEGIIETLQKAKTWLISLQNSSDGGFNGGAADEYPFDSYQNFNSDAARLAFTYFSISSLDLLAASNEIDVEKVSSFIASKQTAEGYFPYLPSVVDEMENQYYAIATLKTLSRLSLINSAALAKWILDRARELQFNESLAQTYFLVSTLDLLGHADNLNQTDVISSVPKDIENYKDYNGGEWNDGSKHANYWLNFEDIFYATSILEIFDSVSLINRSAWANEISYCQLNGLGEHGHKGSFVGQGRILYPNVYLDGWGGNVFIFYALNSLEKLGSLSAVNITQIQDYVLETQNSSTGAFYLGVTSKIYGGQYQLEAPGLYYTFNALHDLRTVTNLWGHTGDLIIDGTQTFVIENCTYIQTGNIIAKESARLAIRDAYVSINMTYRGQYNILVQDNATMEINNSKVMGTFGYGLSFIDQANGTIYGSELDLWIICRGNSRAYFNRSKFSEIHVWDNSEVRITESEARWTINLDLAFYNNVTVANLKPGFYTYWSLRDVVHGVSQEITLENTTARSWSLDLSYSNAITIVNSTLERMRIEFGQIEVNISDVRLGFFQNWTLGGITLLNSSVVGHWHFQLFNTSGTIRNCYVAISFVIGGTLFVADSTFYFDAIEFFGAIFFHNATCIDCGGFYNSRCFISGNIQVEGSSGGLVSSSVDRNYKTVTEDTNGSAVGNAQLTLFGQDGTVIWSGLTDTSGEANFNLTFTDSNYTDTLRLEASKGELFAAKNISFLSDTPVTLVMMTTATADINSDGSVDIYDAILLANSYNSIPSSPNWNPKADLNSDNIVDIYDAIILANNYGKTA